MAIPMIFLAAQASGIAMNIYGNRQADRIMRAGNRVDKAQIDLQMEQDSLASVEQSLFETENLREVMASQRAIFGARGQMTGSGSALAIEQKSLRAYGADERARSLSLGFRQASARGQKTLLDIGRQGAKAQRAGQLLQNSINQFSANSLGAKGATAKTKEIQKPNNPWALK